MMGTYGEAVTGIQASLINAQSFRDVLVDEYERRQQRRPAYSYRAYARDLGLKPTSLSGILNGRDGISRKTALAVSKRLLMSGFEQDLFVDLVESKHARTKLTRGQAALRLEKLRRQYKFNELPVENFNLFEEWYITPILELISIQKGKADNHFLMEKLRISETEAEHALAILKSLGAIVSTTAGYERKKSFLKANGKTASTTLRRFHKTMLAKAADAVDQQTIEERKFINSVFAVDSKRITEARNWLSKMHSEFISEFGSTKEANAVYAVGIQLFKITEGKQ